MAMSRFMALLAMFVNKRRLLLPIAVWQWSANHRKFLRSACELETDNVKPISPINQMVSLTLYK
jgi:hypothetical protein